MTEPLLVEPDPEWNCPYRHSDDELCVISDGPGCYANNPTLGPICLGCDWGPAVTGITPTPTDALSTFPEPRILLQSTPLSLPDRQLPAPPSLPQ